MIENPKILLRSIEDSDIDLIRKWNYDPEVSRYFDSRFPISMAEQRKWFEAQLHSSTKKKLIIVERISGAAIGMIGIMKIDHLNKNCEMGITIGDKTYWGTSIAKESMEMVLKYLFFDFNMHLVYLTVFETNLRAVRFFEKVGFKKSGTLRDMIFKENQYHSYAWMSILKSDFEANISTK